MQKRYFWYPFCAWYKHYFTRGGRFSRFDCYYAAKETKMFVGKRGKLCLWKLPNSLKRCFPIFFVDKDKIWKRKKCKHQENSLKLLFKRKGKLLSFFKKRIEYYWKETKSERERTSIFFGFWFEFNVLKKKFVMFRKKSATSSKHKTKDPSGEL